MLQDSTALGRGLSKLVYGAGLLHLGLPGRLRILVVHEGPGQRRLPSETQKVFILLLFASPVAPKPFISQFELAPGRSREAWI